MKLLILNGPNLNMLGIREPDIYGRETYASLLQKIEAHAAARGHTVECKQSNHEGALVDEIQAALGRFDGIVINPGAYTHTSVALLDALKAVGLPAVEVHISDVSRREGFRQTSYLRAACVATIAGHGTDGYLEAIDLLADPDPARRTRHERVTIRPGRACGSIVAPPSKSVAHRLLIGAALAKGESILYNLAPSQDILATADCLRALGAEIEGLESGTATVRGIGGVPSRAEVRHLFCRESGSTLRFLLPLCLLDGCRTVLHGEGRLMKRPLSVYEELCRERGMEFSQEGDTVTVCGRLTPGIYSLRGDVSSQFITGLMLALSLLPGESRIRLTTPIESRSYLDLTEDALAAFGISVRWLDARELLIPGAAVLQPTALSVEGDYSNAAFFAALDALGGSVRIEGLREDSRQGDRVYRDYFRKIYEFGNEPEIRKNCEIGGDHTIRKNYEFDDGHAVRINCEFDDGHAVRKNCENSPSERSGGATSANGSGDAPANGSGDASANGSGDASVNGSGDAPANGSGDAPANGSGDASAALADERPILSLADCPDLGPVLMALAAAKHGAVFTDTARLRSKESDRIAAMTEELAAFGVPLTVSADGNRVEVPGGLLRAPSRVLCGHNDHRIVMALSVLCTLNGGTVTDVHAVNKSMPDFFERLRSLGITLDFHP